MTVGAAGNDSKGWAGWQGVSRDGKGLVRMARDWSVWQRLAGQQRVSPADDCPGPFQRIQTWIDRINRILGICRTVLTVNNRSRQI